MAPGAGAFVVASSDGEPVACGGVQELEPGVGEIKRMWVHPGWRGAGLGSRLLRHLEQVTADLGHTTVRLDTNGTLVEAIAMYERAGYRHIGRYNDNPYAQAWFEKELTGVSDDCWWMPASSGRALARRRRARRWASSKGRRRRQRVIWAASGAAMNRQTRPSHRVGSPSGLSRSQSSSTGSSRASAQASSWSRWCGDRGSPEAPIGTTQPLRARSARSHT